jgi:three-Cys-motif partner protein
VTFHASPENTPKKQDDLRALAGAVFGIAHNARRQPWVWNEITVVDLTAGRHAFPDRNGDMHEGSPTILLRLLNGLNTRYRVVFVERDPDHVADLSEWLDRNGHEHDPVAIVTGDHNDGDTLAEIKEYVLTPPPRRSLGLIYVDLDGGGLIPCDTIRGLLATPGLDRLDVLLHVSANSAYKRPRRAGYHERSLVDDVKAIGKRYWHVREANTAHQWVMALGSDTNHLENSRWGVRGFITGEPAFERLAELDRTLQELYERDHPRLFETA